MGSIGEIVNNAENWSPSSSSSVAESVKFYEDVMGFVLIKSPSSFDFEGAWLFNHGIGIHLLQSNNVPPKKEKINPKDNHISFQCTDMHLVMQKLEEKIIEYVTATVREGGITVDINSSSMTLMAAWLRFASAKTSLCFHFPLALSRCLMPIRP